MEGLVGREAELDAIGDALRRSDLAGAMLVGDAGVGKSHLLGAALRHAEEQGFVTVSITGSRALDDIPLAAFAGLLPGRIAGDAGDLVQIRRILRERAGSRPLLLGLDDAHLLDEASAALAHQLAADLTAFVIGTIRVGEAPPEAIGALLKDGLAVRIAVDPMSSEHLGAFAALTLGAPVTEQLAVQLYDRTLGNPLFARELLLGAREAGTIAIRDAAFDVIGELVAPPTLTQFVEARLAGLTEAHQRAVALVALGGPLEIELLEQLVDTDVLVELETARLLVADEADDTLVVRFVHPVYADAGRRTVGRLAARQMLRELADALEARPGQRPQDVLRIATWRLDGGSAATPALLAAATGVATARNDFALAERLALAWFDLVADTPDGLRAAVRLAGAFVEQGRFADADAVLTDERVDRSAAAPADRLRTAVLEANLEFWSRGRVQPALDVLDALAAGLDPVPPQLDAAKAAILSSAGLPDEAMALVPLGSPAAATPTGVAANLLSLTSGGRPQHAVEELGPMTELGGHAGGAITAAAHAFALVEAGRLRDAAELSLDGWDRAVRDGDRHGQVAWSISLGWVDLNLGRHQAAAQWFERSSDLARRSAAAVHGTRWALGGLLLARATAGDVDGARAVVTRIDAMPPHEARAHADFELRGPAWLRAAEGDVEGAVDELLTLAEQAAQVGRVAPRLRLLADVARLDDAEVARRRLDSATLRVDGTFLPTLADSIVAFADADPLMIASVAERFAADGFGTHAAECAARAWTVLRYADGEARLVAQFARRAQELREAIDTHATPVLANAAPEVSLSRREREIALLVASGRTSRDVADELIIGIRTVESHLARVYAKLGVRARGELAEALGLTGATT